ncbi:isopenicillin N synthase family oxygenase [Microcoleus sp. FACHB-831]|uniref:isopenicillin N synthase family dioxygenase n=1 Tax=Microcoleus sp. FACHB-831 TaxID=2692827 RepID=UPI001682BFF0|nr:isopenicillin N synthase family oxygenase [Microcoleus sp. FACHB-831]MBD1921704.1 isopenicillin N synthase family oxygenase [Microcoleus sp. FACHB-831]
MVDIPVIDLGCFVSGDAYLCQNVAQEIYQACHEIGFMYLNNSGISPTLIEEIFIEMKQFFKLPFEVKNKVAWSDAVSNRGYVGVERERLDPDKPGDLKEAFNVGKEDNFTGDNSSIILNRWPAGQDKFRETVLEFYQACSKVADTILQAFAIALQLPESFFTLNHTEQNHTLRLLHYPPLNQIPLPGQVRAGEHTDYGTITLLFQDDVGGLEVCTAEGEWIAAPSIPGTIVVNTGDLMQRWTNHIFCSTKHRVMVPGDGKKERSRYSIAFFCHPNNDTQISCLESCQNADFSQLYPPISAGDYLLSRLQATY